ncbi:crossover junction endodeoxyribonuclease RuvC [Rothia sp. ZJ932]|uniref:crossover junction endodeoxyribonuclease RuvC n=1 Tax=Rothia sp. ZJ932 TaxID=2810516 RepID=UPI00196775DE|nr:crossover junction endodeoxyribonuclease RuvC [Rothia sp. ZJ932]QRZ62584.1 crossover junction endodeoxyribonuclease RuvC [Rothia sp. ZJ932]
MGEHEARVPGAARILGVDPGLTRCGFGVVDMTANRKAYFVDVGVAGTAAAQPLDTRVHTIFEAAGQWLDAYKPDALAIERIFAQEQVNTVIGTAHASGVVIAAAASRGIPVFFHTPSEVKAAVTGSGRADKPSVQRMVARILGLETLPKPADAADALALAICHGWRGGGIGSGINMAATTQTHQGSRPSAARVRRIQNLTPAQQAWADAEAKARRAGQ